MTHSRRYTVLACRCHSNCLWLTICCLQYGWLVVLCCIQPVKVPTLIQHSGMQGMAADFEGLTAADLEALDPHPDVHALFNYYNQLYFGDCLGACSVEWSSKRMTLCAGVCHFQRGGGCRIKLSEPLLKYRPVKDLKETLLHEMIHAELFLKGVRDDGDHGPKFRARMEAINKATFLDTQRPAEGYNITVYHTMHDEVNLYRTHVWCCTRCGNTVKRSMNRPPQEADCRAYSKAVAAAAAVAGAPGSYCQDERCWYHSHLRLCGGQYNKIQEPTTSSKATSSSVSGSSKRLKQPTAAGTAAARPIEAFFKPDRRQQQHQQPQASQQQEGARDKQQRQLQRQAGLQEGVRSGQQQESQQQPMKDYWQAVGTGRLLGGSSQGSGSQSATSAAGAAKQANIPKQQQQGQQQLAFIPQPASQPGPDRSLEQQQQQVKQAGVQLQAQVAQRPMQQEHPKQRKQGSRPVLQQLQQHKQDMDHVVDLLSSDDEDDSAGANAATSAAGSRHGAGQAVLCAMACPVCCQEWLPGEISNEQLNLHLDKCLARMHC